MQKFFGGNFWGFIAGGVTAVISAIVGLTPLQIGLVSIAVGVLFGIIHHYYESLAMLAKRARLRSAVLFRVISRRVEANELFNLKHEQQKNPEKWLYPVIEYIDLNRQGSAHDDNDVYVNFHIDSGLLYPISEYCLSVKLCLSIQNTGNEVESGWFKIAPLEPLRALKRNGVGNKYDKNNTIYEKLDWGRYVDNSYIIHLGLTDEAKGGNKVLLKWMEEFRKEREGKECFVLNSEEPKRVPEGDKLLAMLKIGIAFKKEDEDNPFLLEGSRWIVPASNYRGG